MQDYPEKLCPATNEAILHADKHAVQELVLWAENTREVQDALAPITKNLARHFLRGEYDPALAVKACYPAADIAAISYEREFGVNKNATKVSDVTWCTPQDRRAAAHDILGGTQDAIREAVDARRAGAASVKTIEGWNRSSALEIEDYLQIGDRVDAGMVEYFRNVVSPTTNDDGLVQAGEAYSRQAHPLTGEIQDTYLTFTALAAEESAGWVYCGDCFRGDIIPHVEAIAAVHPENKALSIHAADYKDRLASSNGKKITNEPSQPSPVKDARLSRASASTRKTEKALRRAPAKTQR